MNAESAGGQHFTIRHAVYVEPVIHANPAIPCYGTESRVAGSAA